jgi:hypothetical protein
MFEVGRLVVRTSSEESGSVRVCFIQSSHCAPRANQRGDRFPWFRLSLTLLLVISLIGLCQAQSTAPNPSAPVGKPQTANHPPSASFEDPNLMLEDSHTAGKIPAWVRIDNLPENLARAGTVPKVEDKSSQVGTSVTFTNGTKGNATADSVEWQFDAIVSGLPLNSSVKRKAGILLGDSINATVDYTLTNIRSGPFTWTVKGPVEQWVLAANPQTSLVVIIGDRPARNVSLVQSGLQDSTSKHQVGLNQLILCKEGDITCQQEGAVRCAALQAPANATQISNNTAMNSQPSAGDLPPRRASTLALSVCPQFKDSGVFAGSVTLGTAEDATTQAVNLTILASSPRKRLVGFISILAGLLVWLFTALILRRQFNRNQLLQPFAELHDTLVGLRATILNVKCPNITFNQTVAQLTQLEQGLSEKRLGNVIPSSLPSLLSNDSGTSSAYQQMLATVTEQVGAQTIVVRGISAAWGKWNKNPAQQALVTAALQVLDNLNAPPAPVSTQVDAQNAVTATLNKLNADIAALPGAALAAAAPTAPSLPTAREIQIRNQHLNYLAWLVWFVLTLAIGYYVMISTFPGFGTVTDLWKCFFWGLGIPLVGQQIQQLSPSTVSNTLNFSVPKA